MRNAFVKTLTDIAAHDQNILLITGDLGFGVLTDFQRRFPSQFINAGIAEQNMASVAAALAREGKTVYCYSIGNFTTMRCLEQIRNDCAYHEAGVVFVSVGGGYSYGALGVTHHATEDLAIMRALPNVSVFAPCDAAEAAEAVHQARRAGHPCYIRLGKNNEPEVNAPGKRLLIGSPIMQKSGDRVAIFSTGTIAPEAMGAANALDAAGISTAFYTVPALKPFDASPVIECARGMDLIVSVEEHNIIGGLGSAIAEAVAEMGGERARLLRIGIKDVFASIVGSQEYLRMRCGLTASEIAASVRSVLEI